MVLVPTGEFIMGSNDGEDDEKPRRRVHLGAFYIDKYPVTNSRFQRLGKPDYDAGAKFNGDRQPVVGVTWFQARDYCKSVGEASSDGGRVGEGGPRRERPEVSVGRPMGRLKGHPIQE